MKKILMSVVRGEEGASMVEYGLLVALIAVFALGALTLLGGGVVSIFTDAAAGLGEAGV